MKFSIFSDFNFIYKDYRNLSIKTILLQSVNTFLDVLNIYFLSNIVSIKNLYITIFYFNYSISIYDYVILYSGFAIIKFIIQVFSNKFIFQEIQQVEFSLKTKLFSHISVIDQSSFVKLKSSEVSYSITELCKQFSNGLLLPVYKAINEFALIFLTVCYLILLDTKLFIFTFFYFALVNLLFNLFSNKKNIQFGEISNNINEKLVNLVNVVLRGHKEIFTNNKSAYFNSIFLNLISDYKNIQIKYLLRSVMPKYFFELITTVYIVLSVFLLNYFESDNIIFILSTLALISIKIIPSLATLKTLFIQINFNLNSKEKITNFLNLKSKKHKKPIIFEEINKLELKNLTFGYADNELIFDQANLVLLKGNLYVMSGSSGIGKTTFIDILSSLIDPNDINILVNDEEVLNLLGNITYMSQEPFIIDGGLSQNISFNQSANTSIDNKLLIRSGLIDKFGEVIIKTSDFIENGKNLSGGQKQRIGFARLLYGNSNILILDEFSSSLDEINTLKLIKTLQEIKNDHIIICVSHDRLVIDAADKIIKIKNTKIQVI